MRKSVKAQLAKSLADSVDSSEHNRQATYVLDGRPIAQGKVRKENVIPRGCKTVAVCPMYEVNMEKAVLFLMVMSRDHQ